MNKILLTSLALFTFVNYNNSPATTTTIEEIVSEGTTNF